VKGPSLPPGHRAVVPSGPCHHRERSHHPRPLQGHASGPTLAPMCVRARGVSAQQAACELTCDAEFPTHLKNASNKSKS
jgi:hypothetical protein